MDNRLEMPATERRRLTRNSIYQLIYHAKTPVSKQEIAGILGYSLPTVHQNIQELLEAGLIRVGEVKKSTGGRPPAGYEICPDAKFSVGAAITENHIRFLACNLDQEELAYRSIRVPNLDVESFGGEKIKQELNKFLKDSHLDIKKMLGLGVTIPGVLDEKNDIIILSPTLKAKNISMKKFVEEAEFKVRVRNDSTSAGKAELQHRQEMGESLSFGYLFLENGVGGAVFHDGHLIEGTNNRAAEFGHMRIVPKGRDCNCGQKGCLEAYCSMLRITRDYGIPHEEFFERVHAGDKEAKALWEDMLEHLAIGIINIRMAADSDVILGGLLTIYLRDYLEELRSMVSDLDPFGSSADYVKLSFNPRAAMRGAAWEFSEEYMKSI